MSFGETVKNLRIAQGKTLRQFCAEHGHDPSNWSKIERGVNQPPKDNATHTQWAKQLSLKSGTEEWEDFMYQASISRGDIPPQVLSDKALVAKLPVFLRTVTNAELTEEQLDDFIAKVREAHTPDPHER